jgi:hypothetical protein
MTKISESAAANAQQGGKDIDAVSQVNTDMTNVTIFTKMIKKLLDGAQANF